MELKYFKYKAKDRNGYDCAGTVKASNEEDARTRLELKDLKPFFLEEDTEATRRVNADTMKQQIARKRRSSLKNEILSYAMPAAAILIALAGIPIAMNFIKPPSSEVTPQSVIEDYYTAEKEGRYEDQFELLSSDMQKSFASADDYRDAKRRERTSDEKNLYLGRLNHLEEIEGAPRKKIYKGRILRSTGVDLIYVHLVPARGKWRIDAVRDPKYVERYLSGIREASSEEKRRALIVELKSWTAYSDLEIQDLLKKYSFAKKEQELGGVNRPFTL